jgi:methionyl aminopeptidase
MAITIEPMINLGGPAVRVLPDGWTVVTADGRWSAQFEHTLLVTRDGAEVLTGSPALETRAPPEGRAPVSGCG